MAVFGKGRRHKTSNEKFVIQKGVDAGNLKGRGEWPTDAPDYKGTPLNKLSFPEPDNQTNYSVINRGKS